MSRLTCACCGREEELPKGIASYPGMWCTPCLSGKPLHHRVWGLVWILAISAVLIAVAEVILRKLMT